MNTKCGAWPESSGLLFYSPGGGGIFFPLFGPLIISLRLGYLKAVSTSCWQIISTSEDITVHMSSVQKTILLY